MLLENYVAAGFEASAFWRLTPRLFVVEMNGAKRRAGDLRACIAEAAWIGSRTDERGLASYVDFVTGVERALPPEAMGGMLQAASADLPKVTMAEYLESKG